MEKNRRGSRSGRTLRGSSSNAGRPRHESSIEKNYLKSSSIAKNCFRSSSTWTSGVHRDKESLPNAKSPETRLEHVCQSARRDCRVSTNPGAWIGAQRGVRRIRLHYHPQEVWSRCTVQVRAHICELCLPTERGNTAADRCQSGHQAHIYEMCLSAERGMDMDTGKEVLFALPLFKIFSPSTPPGVSVETTTGQHIDVIANYSSWIFHTTFQPSGGTEDGGSFL